DDLASGLDAVGAGHLDVHQDDVRPHLAGPLERRTAVAGLGHDLDVVLGIQESADAGSDQGLIVGEDDPDHAVAVRGSSAATRNPPIGRGSATRRPPSAVTRSRMPISPSPGVGVATSTVPGFSTTTW